MVLASFIGYGAGLGQEGEALTPQDRYFVNHWWDMIQPLLPVMTAQCDPLQEMAQRTAAGTTTTGLAVIVDPTPAQVQRTRPRQWWERLFGAVWERLLASAVVTQELDMEVGTGAVEDGDHRGRIDESEDEHQDVQDNDDKPCTAQMIGNAGALKATQAVQETGAPMEMVEDGPGAMDGDTFETEDLVQVAVQMEAALYQDWEDWLLRESHGAGADAGVKVQSDWASV